MTCYVLNVCNLVFVELESHNFEDQYNEKNFWCQYFYIYLIKNIKFILKLLTSLFLLIYLKDELISYT